MTLPVFMIEVQNLSKSYRIYQKQGGVWASLSGLFHREFKTIYAVRDVSFSIEQGEMVAFLGPNGAGKTTTLKLLSGLIYPSDGSATVMGFVPWKRENQYRRRFSLVMGQKNQLWWDLPAQDSFRLHKEIYRIENEAYQRRLEELLELLDVREQMQQPVRELSLGQRMRMELIAALLHDPQVLFLDEPTIGLDVVSQAKVQAFLKHYQDERKLTVLLTSHYMKDVEALCARAIIIDDGELRHDGMLSDVLERFNVEKLVTIQFAHGDIPQDIGKYGTVVETNAPRIKLRVRKQEVPQVLSAVLNQYDVEDIAVHERPLEEVIASIFAREESLSARRRR